MDTEVRNQFISSSWISWIGELVAMLAFLTAIFVLTLLFFIIRKGTCKTGSEDLHKYIDVDSYIQRSSVYNKARKKFYSDTPPQVPVRPISYTPSVPGECRNNQGSMPEISSFTPDPLFGLRKTVAVCSVAPNLPQYNASHSHSEKDAIQQVNWDEECDEKDLTSCLANEDDSLSFSHDNRGLRSMCSLQSDITDDNSYYWDTSDCLENIYSPGIQGFLQYEFVQMSSSMHTTPDIVDMDYLTAGDDIENFLSIPALRLNTDMSAVPDYDQHTRPEVHHAIHPTLRTNSMFPSQHSSQHVPHNSSQHVPHSHGYPHPIEATFGMYQGQYTTPTEISDSLESPL